MQFQNRKFSQKLLWLCIFHPSWIFYHYVAKRCLELRTLIGAHIRLNSSNAHQYKLLASTDSHHDCKRYEVDGKFNTTAFKITITSAKKEIFTKQLHPTIYTIHKCACSVLLGLCIENIIHQHLNFPSKFDWPEVLLNYGFIIFSLVAKYKEQDWHNFVGHCCLF